MVSAHIYGHHVFLTPAECPQDGQAAYDKLRKKALKLVQSRATVLAAARAAEGIYARMCRCPACGGGMQQTLFGPCQGLWQTLFGPYF